MIFQPLIDAFERLQQALFESVMQPFLFHAGLGNLLEDGYAATGWFLVGVIQVILMLLLLSPLQRLVPAEAQPTGGRAVRVDVVYTLLHRLGLFRLAMFFSIDPLLESLFGLGAVQGIHGIQLDASLALLWPDVLGTAWGSFLVYLLVFDLVDYLIHRGQHRFDSWWALHAVHHSQRQMTLWSDNRNHLLDDLIRGVLLAVVARLIGVAPGQFVALVAVSQLFESFSHANVRVSFGWLGDRLLVSPRFHRQHHAMGVGHESSGPGSLGGCNFSVLFPIWDLLFGTARFDGRYEPTGIRDQLPAGGGRDYGEGFWRQQWLGVLRMLGRRERA